PASDSPIATVGAELAMPMIVSWAAPIASGSSRAGRTWLDSAGMAATSRSVICSPVLSGSRQVPAPGFSPAHARSACVWHNLAPQNIAFGWFQTLRSNSATGDMDGEFAVAFCTAKRRSAGKALVDRDPWRNEAGVTAVSSAENQVLGCITTRDGHPVADEPP